MRAILVLFTLALFLLAGTAGAQVISVASGLGTLSTAYASAPAGAILELTDAGSSTAVYVEQTDITITKDVTIRAKAGLATKPILYGNGTNVLYQTSGRLTVQGIHFEGLVQGTQSPAYFIAMKADSILNNPKFSLFIDNCEFYNGVQRAIYTSDGTFHPLDTLSVTNCVFVNMTKAAIYEKGTRNSPTIMTQPGGCRYLKFENCLIYNTKKPDSDGYGTYIEPANRDDSTFTWPKVFINHVTMDSSAYGGLNTYTTPAAVIQNCIVVNNKVPTNYAYGAETGRWVTSPRSSVKYCLYYNARFVTYGDTTKPYVKYPDTSHIINAYPLFKNKAAMDYSLLAGSPGKAAGNDGRDLGYIAGGLTSVEPITNMPIPGEFRLSQNFPNPFNPSTIIEFSVPKSGQYSITVFNLLGQEVARVFDQNVTVGSYKAHFDAGNLASGVYIYTLRGANVMMSKSMMLLK